VGFDGLIDFGHEADSFFEGDDDAVVVGDDAGAPSAGGEG